MFRSIFGVHLGSGIISGRVQFSVGCSLCMDSSVKGCSIVVKYSIDSWHFGDPQNETMGCIGMLGLCSFANPHSFAGRAEPLSQW